ncbi:unnamed protein product [Amoebophrya sp. A25]|nr:unnamed protein product [Amoebophrya sp. A25]|eukprot:GSA25T00026047001.1
MTVGKPFCRRTCVSLAEEEFGVTSSDSNYYSALEVSASHQEQEKRASVRREGSGRRQSSSNGQKNAKKTHKLRSEQTLIAVDYVGNIGSAGSPPTAGQQSFVESESSSDDDEEEDVEAPVDNTNATIFVETGSKMCLQSNHELLTKNKNALCKTHECKTSDHETCCALWCGAEAEALEVACQNAELVLDPKAKCDERDCAIDLCCTNPGFLEIHGAKIAVGAAAICVALYILVFFSSEGSPVAEAAEDDAMTYRGGPGSVAEAEDDAMTYRWGGANY